MKTETQIKLCEVVGFLYAVTGGALLSIIFDYFLGNQIWTVLAWLCAYILWMHYVQGVVDRYKESLRDDIKMLERLRK